MEPDIERFLKEHTIKISEGEKILLYTDGVTEARNPENQMYGKERLVKSFQTHGRLSIKETIKKVYEDINHFISTYEQYDDITLVGIEKE